MGCGASAHQDAIPFSENWATKIAGVLGHPIAEADTFETAAGVTITGKELLDLKDVKSVFPIKVKKDSTVPKSSEASATSQVAKDETVETVPKPLEAGATSKVAKDETVKNTKKESVTDVSAAKPADKKVTRKDWAEERTWEVGDFLKVLENVPHPKKTEAWIGKGKKTRNHEERKC
jgi:hypothetical protein